MKPVTPAVQSALYDVNLLDVVFLFTFDFAANHGGTKRWSGGNEVTFGGRTWVVGPVIEGIPKNDIRAGFEISELELTIDPGTLTIPDGRTYKLAALDGMFDDVRVLYERGYFTNGVCIGVTTEFDGRIDEVNPRSTELSFKIKSQMARLNEPLPRRSIQAGCPYRVYDPATCKVNKAAFTHVRTVTAATTKEVTLNATSTFALRGSFLEFVTGALAGTTVGIREVDGYIPGNRSTFAGARCFLSSPLRVAPAIGDTVNVVRGCDGSMNQPGGGFGDCRVPFNNVANYGGFPFIPREESDW